MALKQTMLETEYATLWYYPEHRIVHHAFHKYIYGDEFRQVLMKGLATFQQHGAHKWLSDDRGNSALPQADIDWSMENWIPGMLQSGWQYWAVVLPDTSVGKANMKRIIDSYSTMGLTIEVFDNPDDALAWLQSV